MAPPRDTDVRELVSASPLPSAMLGSLEPDHPSQNPVVVQGGKQQGEPWPKPSPAPSP